MKVVGIIGGMGPQATVDLFQKIIDITPAKCDQEHLKILIYCDPTIPDRTRAILGKGSSPVPKLLGAARSLIEMGAELLAIPCNTAHYFVPVLQKSLPVPVIHMLHEVAQEIRRKHSGVEKVGLLATDGTIAAGVYEKALRERSLVVLYPEEAEQRKVMEVIYGERGVKAGTVAPWQTEELDGVIESLRKRGAGAVIAGCTEISYLLDRHPSKQKIPIILSHVVLAEAIVREARTEIQQKSG
ncbi:MAG: amino acid racemase [Firmicutes bacterium]|jgi:aspartate racemase|nr:amino acid racemase [Bacillota bacterium]HQD39229.1 amino acid racemase [Bacillota bacterium]